jgi:hypothetical protein
VLKTLNPEPALLPGLDAAAVAPKLPVTDASL